MQSHITRDLAFAAADMVRISGVPKSSAAELFGVSTRALRNAWLRIGPDKPHMPKKDELDRLSDMFRERARKEGIDVRALHVAHVTIESAIRNEREGANNPVLIHAWCEAMTAIENTIGALNDG